MTGNEVFNRVLNLLGYMDSSLTRADKENLLNRALDIINQICFDLKIPNISLLSDEIYATNISLDALCYGVAMLMTLIVGEVDKNKIFTNIYNAKRTAALSKKDVIEDKLPTIDYGS